MYLRGFALPIFEKVVEDYRDFFSAPNLVAKEFGACFQSGAMPLYRVSEKEPTIA